MSIATLSQAILDAGILDATPIERRAQQAKSVRQFLDNLCADDVPEASLISRLARALGIPRYDPNERSPEPEALALLDSAMADELGVLPVALRSSGTMLWIAVCDPTDEFLISEVERRTGKRVKVCLIGPRELARALRSMATAQPAAFIPSATGSHAAIARPVMPPLPPLPPAPARSPTPFDGSRSGSALEPSLPPGVRPQTGPVATVPAEKRMEDELQQVRAVVKVLTQMLVDKGLLDGEDLKRRLRAERDRKA